MSHPLLSEHDLALVDAVAQRVLEQLAAAGRDTLPARSRLVSAGELAEVLGVSRDYVYRHRAELGAIEAGDGEPSRRTRRRAEAEGAEPRSRPRLRFDPDKALATWTARQRSEESQVPEPPAPTGRTPRARRRSPASEGGLLPVRGRNGGRSATARTP
jgi:hypothetical protein